MFCFSDSEYSRHAVAAAILRPEVNELGLVLDECDPPSPERDRALEVTARAHAAWRADNSGDHAPRPFLRTASVECGKGRHGQCRYRWHSPLYQLGNDRPLLHEVTVCCCPCGHSAPSPRQAAA